MPVPTDRPTMGIPNPTEFGDISGIPLGQVLPFVIQEHNARKAGLHRDVRFGKDQMFSWATKKPGLPLPGEMQALFQTPLHEESYMHFAGDLPPGMYGAGRVRQQEKGSVIVHKSSPDKVVFTTAHSRYPQTYVMIRTGQKPTDWLIKNLTPKTLQDFVGPGVSFEKEHFKNVPAKDVEKLYDPKKIFTEKLDGARVILKLKKDSIEAASYRQSVTGVPIMHTQRLQLPRGLDIPANLVGTTMVGEAMGTRDKQSAESTGMLSRLAKTVAPLADNVVRVVSSITGDSHMGEDEPRPEPDETTKGEDPGPTTTLKPEAETAPEEKDASANEGHTLRILLRKMRGSMPGVSSGQPTTNTAANMLVGNDAARSSQGIKMGAFFQGTYITHSPTKLVDYLVSKAKIKFVGQLTNPAVQYQDMLNAEPTTGGFTVAPAAWGALTRHEIPPMRRREAIAHEAFHAGPAGSSRSAMTKALRGSELLAYFVGGYKMPRGASMPIRALSGLKQMAGGNPGTTGAMVLTPALVYAAYKRMHENDEVPAEPVQKESADNLKVLERLMQRVQREGQTREEPSQAAGAAANWKIATAIGRTEPEVAKSDLIIQSVLNGKKGKRPPAYDSRQSLNVKAGHDGSFNPTCGEPDGDMDVSMGHETKRMSRKEWFKRVRDGELKGPATIKMVNAKHEKVSATANWKELAKSYYANTDAAHGLDHIYAVLSRARPLAAQHYPEGIHVVNRAAFLHDIGNSVSRDTHEIIGEQIARNNPKLLAGLTDPQSDAVLEAILQHRSSTGKPQGVVGQIISDADRLSDANINPEQAALDALRRAVLFGQHKFPELSPTEHVSRAVKHQVEKYGDPSSPGRRVYFPETDKILAQRAGFVDALGKLPPEELAVRLGVGPKTAADEPLRHVFITGAPGSGKTTLAKQLSKELGLPMVSTDNLKPADGETYPDQSVLAAYLKRVRTPKLIEGVQVMYLPTEHLQNQRVILLEQSRKELLRRLAVRGMNDSFGDMHKGPDDKYLRTATTRFMKGVERFKKQFPEHELYKEARASLWKRLLQYRLIGNEPGHKYQHALDVRNHALETARLYGIPVPRQVVSRAALLHDIAANKPSREYHEIMGEEFVRQNPKLLAGIDPKWHRTILDAIRHHRSSTGAPEGPVGQAISDADRISSSSADPMQIALQTLRRDMTYSKETSPAAKYRESLEYFFHKFLKPDAPGRRAYYDRTKQQLTGRTEAMGQLASAPFEESIARANARPPDPELPPMRGSKYRRLANRTVARDKAERAGVPLRTWSNMPKLKQVQAPSMQEPLPLPEPATQATPAALGETLMERTQPALKTVAEGYKMAQETIPAQELGGLLNSSLAESLRKQREKQIEMKVMLFNILSKGKKPVGPEVPYKERLAMMRDIMNYLPGNKIQMPVTAETPEAQKAMWEGIASGKNPRTSEGVVVYPETGTPTKVKLMPEYDVLVRKIFPGLGKYEGLGAGGFEYSLPGSENVVGKVGTGLSDELRRELLQNPEAYLGRTARIQAMGQYPSGAYRAPALVALHEG